MTPTHCLALLDNHWAVEPHAFSAALEQLAELDWDAHLAEFRSNPTSLSSSSDAPPYTVDEHGIARFPIEGPLTREAHSMSSMFGGTATIPLRAALQQASADKTVKGILLAIHSPGGQVAGTQGVASTVAGIKKPVVAYCDELCASAAYWIASQANEIVATPTALVGSIGVLSLVKDTSERNKMQGVKVHTVASGPLKGAGAEGTPVTDDHLAAFQKNVDGLFQQFASAVSVGRRLTGKRLDAVTAGNTFLADEAKTNGLIDRIGGEETAYKRLLTLITTPAARKPSGGKENAHAMTRKEFWAWLTGAPSAQSEDEQPEANLPDPVDPRTFLAHQNAMFASVKTFGPSEREKALEAENSRLREQTEAQAKAANASTMAQYAREGKFTPGDLEAESALRAQNPTVYDALWAKRPTLNVIPVNTISGDEAAMAAYQSDEASEADALQKEYEAMKSWAKSMNGGK